MVEIYEKGKWSRKCRHSEAEVGIIDIKRNRFLLTYMSPRMNGWSLQKYLGTLPETTLAEKLLPGQ